MDNSSRLTELNVRNEIVTTDARAAVQSAILINGGAAAALLAFAGSQSSASKLSIEPSGIRHALIAYAIGVTLAGVCAATAYLTNYAYLRQAQAYYEQKGSTAFMSVKWGRRSHWLSVTLMVVSWVAFLSGTIIAALAVK